MALSWRYIFIFIAIRVMTPSLTLLAAGSLKSAFLPLLARFQQLSGIQVEAQFGPAGLLRERIEGGERCSLFAVRLCEYRTPSGAAASRACDKMLFVCR